MMNSRVWCVCLSEGHLRIPYRAARDTFEYIKGRCEAALKMLPTLKAAAGMEDRGKNGNGGGGGRRGKHQQQHHRDASAALASLAKTIQRLGEIHREVEFQWIRMFWLQGTRHAESHRGYWKPRVEELTQAWERLELFIHTPHFIRVFSKIVFFIIVIHHRVKKSITCVWYLTEALSPSKPWT